MQPPVRVDGRRRLIGLVQIAAHDVVAADHNLTGLAARDLATLVVDDLHLDAGDGAARRVGDRLGIVVVPAHGRDAARLRQPVAGDDRLERELLAHPQDELDRCRRRARHRQAQAREVVLIASGMVEDRLVQRRRTGKDRDAVTGDAFEDLLRIEHGLRKHGRAHHQRRQPSRLVPERVEERIDDQVPVVLSQPDDFTPVAVCAQRLGVREHRTLGIPGSARREEDVGQVTGLDRLRPSFGERGIDGRSCSQELAPRPRSLGRFTAQDDDRLEVRKLRVHVDRLPEQRDVVGVEEAGDRHQRLGPGLPEDVRRLPALEPGIERDQHRAGGVQAEGGHDPLPRVRRPDRHPVTTFDPHRQERTRRVVRGRSQARERQGPPVAHVYDRLSCREALRGALNEPRRCCPFEVAANAGLAH